MCAFARALAGALLLALHTAPMADDLFILDDRAGSTPRDWRFFSDGVMGGLSSGSMTAQTVAGRPALCLRGRVRLDNNGGFVQMALALPPLPAGPWAGIELDVHGNGRRYGLHLRSVDMGRPWQAFRASFDAPPAWQTVRLPFTAFESYRFDGTLEPARLRSLGVLAIGEAMDAELCVARVALVR